MNLFKFAKTLSSWDTSGTSSGDQHASDGFAFTARLWSVVRAPAGGEFWARQRRLLSRLGAEVHLVQPLCCRRSGPYWEVLWKPEPRLPETSVFLDRDGQSTAQNESCKLQFANELFLTCSTLLIGIDTCRSTGWGMFSKALTGRQIFIWYESDDWHVYLFSASANPFSCRALQPVMNTYSRYICLFNGNWVHSLLEAVTVTWRQPFVCLAPERQLYKF